ncbi:MAG TPA: hypothetical protein VLW65_13285 [Bryobacteraceae bacterium]|nr:hypothetical protein [Bryobacteraceae bacterium]
MKNGFKILMACMIFAAAAAAQVPSIAALANNYSYIPTGLPNYGIAQGSIFSIFGSFPNVASSPLQGVPLATKVNGVSVNVTVGSTTTSAIIYYVSTTLIDAILPSGTPVGSGTLTVVTPNTNTANIPITVVQSAFGILTLNQGGTGAAWAFDANNGYATIGYATAANPGDTIVFYGTGLGPVTGDETQTQAQTNLSLPIEVDIGGAVAKVDYHGRTVFPGLDQVNVEVPAGVSGCNVSLVVKTGNYVSNATSIAVAAAGSRTCSDPNTGYSTAVLSKCATSGCSTGGINISKTTTTTQGISVPGAGTVGGGTSTSDSISASFYKITAAQAATGINSSLLTTSIGSCTVITFSYTGNNTPNLPTSTFTPLNAGTINVGGAATTSMAYQNGFYSAISSTGGLIPATGGTFNFTNGSGGPDIGALSGASITLGAPLTSNVSTISTVTRANGQTVTWTGGTAGTYVIIWGDSISQVGTSTTAFVGAYFWCTAPQSAGSFTVPASVLLSLPPTGTLTESGISIPIASFLTVSNTSNPVSFTAPNLDQGILTGSYAVSNQVTYK